MKAAIINWRALAGQRLSPSLSLGVIYANTEDHEHATGVCDFLVAQLGEGLEITATWWRTSVLSDPGLFRAAARAVSTSDLILFSLECLQPPTQHFRSWLESWPSPDAPTRQLVALLHASCSGPSLTEWNTCLRSLALRRRMAYVDATPAAFTDSLLGRPGFEPVHPVSGGKQWTYPYWGLNE